MEIRQFKKKKRHKQKIWQFRGLEWQQRGKQWYWNGLQGWEVSKDGVRYGGAGKKGSIKWERQQGRQKRWQKQRLS